MPKLSSAERVELGAILVLPLFTFYLAPKSGVSLELSELVAGAALLVLLQGFCRDLWLLRQARRSTSTTPEKHVRCMCVESAIGLTGVIAGICLVGAGLTHPVHLSAGALTGGVAAAMTFGFLLKDLVFEWSPWKIYREKDHAQVIFRWKK